MRKDNVIGTYGGVSLIATVICAKSFISAPAFYARQSGSAGWLEVLISGLFELIILAIIFKLLQGFENMDLIDIGKYSFGLFGKAIVGILSCAVFIASAAAVSRCFVEMVRNCIILSASHDYIILFIFAAVLVAAYLGMRTQIDFIGLLVPILSIAIIITLLVNLPRYNINNIEPLLGHGAANTVSNALLKNSTYFELGIILFLAPYLSKKSHVKKVGFTSLGVSILLSSIMALSYQLVVPYKAAGNFTLPMYQMTRMIRAGSFFQRIEPLIIFVWSGAFFVYISVGIWLASRAFQKTFDLKTSVPMTFIFSEIVCILALLPGSETSVEKIYDLILKYAYVVYPILPMFFLVLARGAVLRRKAGDIA